MRGKNLGILAVLFLAVVFVSMGFVSATLTLNTPANNSNISGTTYVLNATLDINNGSYTNLTRAWFYAMYQNGTNITIASFVENVTNVGWNTTWDSNGVVDAGTLTFWAFVARGNGTVSDGNQSTSNAGVYVGNTAPVISFAVSGNYTNATYKANTGQLTLNFSVVVTGKMSTANPCRINIAGTNQTIPLTVFNTTFGTCNTTVANLTGLNDGNATIKLYVNNSATLVGQLATHVVFIDGNAPALEASATEITKEKIALTISTTDGTGTGTNTCTADRAGATVTTTSLTESSLSCATTYTYVITCTDKAGNAGTLSKTFSTNACGASSTSSGGAASKPAVTTVTQITPGAATITKYSDANLGIKEIEISVDNPAQNVQITVTKYDGKPAAVSVAKTGKVYQYLQIDTTNVADKLDKATVKFQVPKSWVTSNSVDKDRIVVSKFDEAAGKWNELTTTAAGDDATHYYYNVELSSFSYFAISEKSLTSGGDSGAVGGEAMGGSRLWLWIVLAVVVIALIAWAAMRKK